MNAEPLTLPLACLLLLAAVPAASAQTLDDQVQDAEAKAASLAEEASDPQQAAANASDPSWQGDQVNWTTTWSCASAYAVDEDVGEAAGQALDCQPPASAQAGEEEETAEQNEPAAEVEEAEDDAEQTARDQAAATEALSEDVQQEPEETPSHLARFLNRTQAILADLLSLPLTGASLAGQGISGAAGALTDDGLAAAEATAGGFHAGATGLADAASATVSSVEAGLEGIAHGAQVTGQAIDDGLDAGLERVEAGWSHVSGALGWDEPAKDKPTPEPDLDEDPLDAGDTITDEVPIELP